MKNLKYLKYALYFFFLIDLLIFLSSQFAPELFLSISPQFNLGGPSFSYPRLVGVLFLMIGIVRLYGGIFIHEKGAFQLATISWGIEISYILIEVVRGQFDLKQNIAVLLACFFMLVWSVYLYRRNVS
jgi:hypothetical protein